MDFFKENKKTFATLIVLFCTAFHFIWAQGCIFDKMVVDKDNVVKETHCASVKASNLNLKFVHKDGQFYLNMKTSFNGKKMDILYKGDELVVELRSYNFLKVKASEKAGPITSLSNNQLRTSYDMWFVLSKEDMQILRDEGFKSFQLELDGGVTSKRVGKNDSHSLRDCIRCLLKIEKS